MDQFITIVTYAVMTLHGMLGGILVVMIVKGSYASSPAARLSAREARTRLGCRLGWGLPPVPKKWERNQYSARAAGYHPFLPPGRRISNGVRKDSHTCSACRTSHARPCRSLGRRCRRSTCYPANRSSPDNRSTIPMFRSTEWITRR